MAENQHSLENSTIPLQDDDEEIFLPAGVQLSAKQRKRIGFTAEKDYRLIFINEWKQEYCETSRRNSKLLDGCGVDFDNIPVRIQLKAGVQQTLSPLITLMYMHNECIRKLPPDSPWLQRVKILIHHKTNTKPKKGEKVVKDGFSKVYMTYKDYLTLSGMCNIDDNKQYTLMSNKVQRDNEFDQIILTTFEYIFKLLKASFPPVLKNKV